MPAVAMADACPAGSHPHHGSFNLRPERRHATCSTGAAVPTPTTTQASSPTARRCWRAGDTQTLAVPTAPGGVNYEESRPDGLFYEVDGEPLPSNGVDALDSRLVGIDLGRLSEVPKSHLSPKGPSKGNPRRRQKLILNLFDDAVFTGIVEHIEPTASAMRCGASSTA